MVTRKPFKGEELLIKWTEFLAEFKSLDNLVPYGTKLNFIQYFSIDVISVIGLTIIIILFIIYKLIMVVLALLKEKFLMKKEKIH